MSGFIRFRRRIRLLPGLHLNLGARGASLSVGVRGAGATYGRDGATYHLGVPGTGLYYVTHFKGARTERWPSGLPAVGMLETHRHAAVRWSHLALTALLLVLIHYAKGGW